MLRLRLPRPARPPGTLRFGGFPVSWAILGLVLLAVQHDAPAAGLPAQQRAAVSDEVGAANSAAVPFRCEILAVAKRIQLCTGGKYCRILEAQAKCR